MPRASGPSGGAAVQNRKVDKTGRSTGKSSDKRAARVNAPPAGEAWVWATTAMLASPAWRALSRSAIQVIIRIWIEHSQHGGRDNGRLPVTFDNFEEFGIDRKNIKASLDEAEALGFIFRTEKGRRAFGTVPGKSSRYGLTWIGVSSATNIEGPGNEWRGIADGNAAKERVAKVRAARVAANAEEKAAQAAANRQRSGKAPGRDIDSSSVFGTRHVVPKTELGNVSPCSSENGTKPVPKAELGEKSSKRPRLGGANG